MGKYKELFLKEPTESELWDAMEDLVRLRAAAKRVGLEFKKDENEFKRKHGRGPEKVVMDEEDMSLMASISTLWNMQLGRMPGDVQGLQAEIGDETKFE